MKSLIVLIVVVLATFALAPTAEAAAGGQGSRFYMDPVPAGCQGISIDPANPCYSSAGYPGCDKNYKTQEACLAYCQCGYKYNEGKCKGGVTCLEVAKAEKRACDYQCIIDFA